MTVSNDPRSNPVRDFSYQATAAVVSGAGAAALNMLNSEQVLLSRTFGAAALGLTAVAIEMSALQTLIRRNPDIDLFNHRMVWPIALTALANVGLSSYLPYSPNADTTNKVALVFALIFFAHFLLVGHTVVGDGAHRKADQQKPVLSIELPD